MVKKEELYEIIENQKKDIACLNDRIVALNKQKDDAVKEAVSAERERIYEEWKKNQGMFMERYIREIISDELDINLDNHIEDYLRDNLSLSCSNDGDYYSRWGRVELRLGNDVIASDSMHLGR